MIPDLDIYHSDQLLVKILDQDAPIHAAMRADAMLEKGDLEGCTPDTRTTRTAPGRMSRSGRARRRYARAGRSGRLHGVEADTAGYRGTTGDGA